MDVVGGKRQGRLQDICIWFRKFSYRTKVPGEGDDGSELRCTWVTQERPEDTAHSQERDGDVGVGTPPFSILHTPFQSLFP